MTAEPASSARCPRAFAWLVVATFALGALLRVPTFTRPILSDDEAIYAVTADAMARGDLLYRDVVDHKPPFIYHVYQAGFAVFGRYDLQGAHAAVVLSVLLTAALLFLIRWRRRDEPAHAPLDSLAAAGLFLVFTTTWHDYDALAANCELFLLAPQTLAAWLLLRALERTQTIGRALAAHLAVGALIGASALFKYQGLTFWGASLGMLAWWAWLGRLSWARAALFGACHVAGALLVPAAYLLGCAAAGNAGATIQWFLFNFSYVGAGLTGLAAIARGLWRLALIGGVAIVPYGLGMVAAFVTARTAVRALLRAAPPPPATAVLGLLWLATSAIALRAGGRFFGHYFHLVLAPLCLLAAPGFVRLFRRGPASRATLVALCALPAVAFFGLATFGRAQAARWDEGEPAYDDVAARIDALTTPDQRIFVWGNSPQLYLLARRPMGARFSFCNYMTGESPGTPTESGQWNADANQLAPSWDMLFDDLERRRPTLLVDAAAAGWDGYDKFPIARYPRLRDYVARHYQPVEVRSGVVLYRRDERTR